MGGGSATRTVSPAATKRSTSFEPRSPVPPVTRIVDTLDPYRNAGMTSFENRNSDSR